ncbi:dihydrofolate reductase [Piscinibacter sakaiensis]|uniref:Dihydrofolate reductase n=2 Tax=Piscinibacter sakaiensis TaxID=1547922 RepID=A0A0K8P2Q3_PISS1|nr:dihydrofolate reductase [Piscinibacter sakaiensis]
MDRHRLIGVGGRRMPWHLPEDLRHFKRTTLGRPVLMGRRTHESIGRVLPGRLNVVLSRGGLPAPAAEGLARAAGLDAALDLATRWLDAHPDAPREIFVIGGAELYAQALPRADRLVLTEIDAVFDGDVHFPDFRADPAWTEVARETARAAPPNGFELAYVTYERAPRHTPPR